MKASERRTRTKTHLVRLDEPFALGRPADRRLLDRLALARGRLVPVLVARLLVDDDALGARRLRDGDAPRAARLGAAEREDVGVDLDLAHADLEALARRERRDGALERPPVGEDERLGASRGGGAGAGARARRGTLGGARARAGGGDGGDEGGHGARGGGARASRRGGCDGGLDGSEEGNGLERGLERVRVVERA